MRGERDEGQAAVELALVLPLLVVLLLAVVQVVLVARDQILVVHAARAGSRQAAVDADAGAARRAVVDAGGGGLEASRLNVELTPAGGRGPLVTATVRYASPTDVPLVGPLLPDVPLRAAATMASELSVPSDSTGQSSGASRNRWPRERTPRTAPSVGTRPRNR